MRKSFTGVTFTPGEGVKVWSQGRKVVTKAKVEDFTTGRHLVWDATNENTICGLTIGLVVWHQLGRKKVHWSKARQTDCRVCRKLVRESIRESRRQRDGGPPYDAATATGMYDPEGA